MVQVDSGADLERLLELCTVKLSIFGKSGWGTGFFVAPGKILTCAHVVKDAGTQPVKVSYQNQQDIAEATVSGLFLDPFDIALLELVQPIPSHPCVYLDASISQEQVIQSNDELYTYGYPDDFPQGGPVTTACEGLTGDRPPLIKFKQGQIRPGLSGSPLLNRRTSKICGIVKFTRDRSNDLGGGAVPAPAILSKFSELESLQTQFHKQDHRWQALLPKTRCSPQLVGLISFGIAIAIGAARFLGGLQDVELKLYDHLMQTRIQQPPDDRLRVITIDIDDVAAQRKRGEKLVGSLSSSSLSKLLTTLSSFKPRVIGLDIYRDNEDNSNVINYFKSQPNLIGVCKANDDVKYQVSGIESPPGIPKERIGFSDFILDGDDVLRRQVLAFQPPTDSPCSSQISFSLQVAGRYLEKDGILYQNPVNKEGICHDIVFNDEKFKRRVVFQNLLPFTGGYQFQENVTNGCQVLLNYRAEQRLPVKTFTLEQVFNNPVDPAEFRDKIVLIGVIHRDNVQDYWNTSYGILPEQEMPGVVAQALMISQVVSAAAGDRVLIWVMPQWAEWGWIILWSAVGGFIGWAYRSPRTLGSVIAIVATSIYIVCLVAFQFNGWLPLLPALLGCTLSGAVVWWVNLQSRLGQGFNQKQVKSKSRSAQS